MSDHEVDFEMVRKAMESEEVVNGMREEWAETYGFVHECRCGRDVLEGKLEIVPSCYADLTSDALATCQLQQSALRYIVEGNTDDPEAFAQEFVQ